MNKGLWIIVKNIRRFWISVPRMHNSLPLCGATVDWRTAHDVKLSWAKQGPLGHPHERAYPTSTNSLLRNITGNLSKREEGAQ